MLNTNIPTKPKKDAIKRLASSIRKQFPRRRPADFETMAKLIEFYWVGSPAKDLPYAVRTANLGMGYAYCSGRIHGTAVNRLRRMDWIKYTELVAEVALRKLMINDVPRFLNLL